jgi:hypothetical protein
MIVMIRWRFRGKNTIRIDRIKKSCIFTAVNNSMTMMKSIENKGITATGTLKNKVAGKPKSLFGLAKMSHTAEMLCDIGAIKL